MRECARRRYRCTGCNARLSLIPIEKELKKLENAFSPDFRCVLCDLFKRHYNLFLETNVVGVRRREQGTETFDLGVDWKSVV